jgi:hypothetical protein
MTDSRQTMVVLGGTGRTGSLVAQKLIADVIGGPVTHNDIDPDAWTGGAIAAGFVPADYAVMLRWLTGTIISGNGSRPNDDIEKVTSRPPITFQDFARRNAPVWTLQAAK